MLARAVGRTSQRWALVSAVASTSCSTRAGQVARLTVSSGSRKCYASSKFVRARAFHSSSVCLATEPFLLHDIGEGITECEVLEWHVKTGQEIAAFDLLCTVQSDKATVELKSRFDGTVGKIYHPAGSIAAVGSPLCDIETDQADSAETPSSPSKPEEATQTSAPAPEKISATNGDESSHQMIDHKGGPVKVLATPATRYLAKKHGIRLADIKGTGRDGRVMKEDVLRFMKETESGGSASSSASASSAASAPLFARTEDRVEPVRGLRRTMIKTMTEASKVPHFGYCDEVLMNRLVDCRAELKAIAAEHGVKLSYMPFFLKAASIALNNFPIVNSSLSPDNSELIYKGAHNIGVAMDTPAGLIVPNVKHCEQRSIMEIAQELNRLIEAGAAGQLKSEDLSGGTFTLSNIGTVGGTYTNPVLVVPEVVIGALGAMQKVPRYNNEGEVFPAQIVNVSWSADHRVIDGATLARFSNKWKESLETPTTMLLHLR